MTATRPERSVVRIVVTPDTTRSELAEAIGHLRSRRDRMPAHWTDRRDEVDDEIGCLIDTWLALQ